MLDLCATIISLVTLFTHKHIISWRKIPQNHHPLNNSFWIYKKRVIYGVTQHLKAGIDKSVLKSQHSVLIAVLYPLRKKKHFTFFPPILLFYCNSCQNLLTPRSWKHCVPQNCCKKVTVIDTDIDIDIYIYKLSKEPPTASRTDLVVVVFGFWMARLYFGHLYTERQNIHCNTELVVKQWGIVANKHTLVVCPVVCFMHNTVLFPHLKADLYEMKNKPFSQQIKRIEMICSCWLSSVYKITCV